jgi:hypothetical protein
VQEIRWQFIRAWQSIIVGACFAAILVRSSCGYNFEAALPANSRKLRKTGVCCIALRYRNINRRAWFLTLVDTLCILEI